LFVAFHRAATRRFRGVTLVPIVRRDPDGGNTDRAPLPVAIDGNFLAMPHSGIGTYLRGLLDGLQRNADALGISVHLVEPGAGRVLHPGGKAHRFAWDAVGVTGGALRMRDPRPKVLHVPQMTAPLWAPVPLVATIHDVIPFVLEDYRASRAMQAYLSLMARTVRRASRVIVPSEAARGDVIGVLGIGPGIVRVIPEAAGEDLVPDETGEAAMRVRKRWEITGPYLFNIGGFDRRKNLPLLVEAFATAVPSLPGDARLVIAGAPHTDNPRVFPPLEPLIAKHGLESRVVLTGRVSDEERRWLYQAARGYITPSMYEGFGLTPLEAMACAVPPIVADRTSLPEVVGEAGLVVEPTVEDLAEAIVALMTDDALRESLSRASLDRARTFTWDAAARETAAVYHEAAGR
jgi:glycosyltransferase involved in cell wall biosynthesis